MIKKFAKSHEWIVVENDVGTVGITDHAQHELTDIVFLGYFRKCFEISFIVKTVNSFHYFLISPTPVWVKS